jgi:hypothetical protein
MKSIFTIATLALLCVPTLSLGCPAFYSYTVSGLALHTSGDGVYSWSIGYQEMCDEDVCVVLDEGSEHRLFRLDSPANFISDCLNKDIDFCAPLDYNLKCTNFIDDNSPECSA